MRAALRAFLAAAGVAFVALLSAPSAGAQATTTTTIPTLPVTGGTTATTAPATAGAGSGSLPHTGLAADALVPFGFVLIGAGGALDAVARRRPKQRLVLG